MIKPLETLYVPVCTHRSDKILTSYSKDKNVYALNDVLDQQFSEVLGNFYIGPYEKEMSLFVRI